MRMTPLLLAVLSVACGAPPEVVLDDTFEAGADGWSHAFADYPPDDDLAMPELYSLDAGLRDLPITGGGQRAYFLGGTNRSDDLWMALVKRVTGLSPSTRYAVRFTVSVASASPSGCAGVGGAPGEALVLKAGGISGLVELAREGRNTIWAKPDKGLQSNAGPDSVLLGTMANGRGCDDPAAFVLLARSGTHTVTSDPAGAMTVFVGTDSGFEGRSEFHYDGIRLELSRAP